MIVHFLRMIFDHVYASACRRIAFRRWAIEQAISSGAKYDYVVELATELETHCREPRPFVLPPRLAEAA